jgi:hypothetical protein
LGETHGLDLLGVFGGLEVWLGELGWPVKMGQATGVFSERLRELQSGGG